MLSSTPQHGASLGAYQESLAEGPSVGIVPHEILVVTNITQGAWQAHCSTYKKILLGGNVRTRL